ncbi:MAG TPA: S9 family peptidase [Steroidobacteraceae bacterium]|nr:S9 family peptidase [Steroidobacteraceae bacterium]
MPLEHRVRWRAAAVLMLSLASGGFAHAGVLDPESLNGWRFVSDPEISPDGSRIVYVLSRFDTEKDDYESDLWAIDGDGEPRPFVTTAGPELNPRWSPDGKRLAFLSARAGKPQVFVMEMTGGEAWQLTKETEGVSGFSWSPDGARIAYLAKARVDQPAAPASGRARITEKLVYRNDGAPGFAAEMRPQLWVVDVKSDAGAALGPLTDGSVDVSTPAWSADGKFLLFSAANEPDAGDLGETTDLYRVAVERGARAEPVTRRKGPDDGPVVAANGALAWTGYDLATPLRSSTTRRLYTMAARATEPQLLTASFDRNVGEQLLTDVSAPRGGAAQLAFAPGGKELLFVAADSGRTRLYSVPVRGGGVRSLSDSLAGDLREFSVAKNGRIAAVFSSPTAPYDVWIVDRAGGKWRQASHHGEQSLHGFAPAPYEGLRVDSFDGQKIQAWLLKPPGFDAAKQYPLLLYIHGGPHTLYGESFFHEMQVHASHGFLVLLANPRGSTGYGEAFANSVQYRYPGDDFRDLTAVLDSVIARGYVDDERLGVGGGSGGGLLTSWIVGHTTRFSAALVERPVVNWITEATVADIHSYVATRWFRDFPWRDPADYLARSPIFFVDKVETPVLVIQSEQDYRTPFDQGIQFYTALRMLGKPAKLALFPTSSHGLSRNGPPAQRVERLKIILDWFQTKLEGVQP